VTSEAKAIASELHDLKDGLIHEWFKSQLREVLTASIVCADETRLRWLQGEAQRLNKIIDGIETAFDSIKQERERERIERLKDTLRPPGKMQGAF
jgi:hypothetical protein